MNPLEEIKRITQEITNVKDISTTCQERHIVRARAIFYKVASEESEMSLANMSAYIGRKHSIALHALRRFDKHMFQSDVFRKNYELVKKEYSHLARHGFILDLETKELTEKYGNLQRDYDTVIKKQRKDRRKLLVFLRAENISTRLVDISKDLDSKQIEQMFERMEQFAKMCNYHNEKKKVL